MKVAIILLVLILAVCTVHCSDDTDELMEAFFGTKGRSGTSTHASAGTVTSTAAKISGKGKVATESKALISTSGVESTTDTFFEEYESPKESPAKSVTKTTTVKATSKSPPAATKSSSFPSKTTTVTHTSTSKGVGSIEDLKARFSSWFDDDEEEAEEEDPFGHFAT